MATRRVSLLVGLLCLIASTSVAAAPLIDGKISGLESCWQEACGFAAFAGTFNGKVNGEHTTGYFSGLATHEDLKTQPGETTAVNPGGFWLIWTKLAYFEGTIIGGTLTARKNDRFDLTLKLQLTKPVETTATLVGVLDHSGLDKQPIPEPPTIMADIFSGAN
ncbi:MAG TPA: hypothetical protein VFT23_02225 [Burkholderiales bacterium]|nr:hypothetical protein [Burkholderiales bacterium]